MHEPHVPSCVYAEVKTELLEAQRQNEINRDGWIGMACFLGSVQTFLSPPRLYICICTGPSLFHCG